MRGTSSDVTGDSIASSIEVQEIKPPVYFIDKTTTSPMFMTRTSVKHKKISYQDSQSK